ncbi:hypothetical protein [Marinobacter alexandrii]|jgi:hypothetical protein|uniref:hypothetical protein n=1 Tax=Marinobacter alexandrii TaxID=2570351 RepID=UPI002ABDD3A1|nr:hypothetical protein [Marinobacter alexandrii]
MSFKIKGLKEAQEKLKKLSEGAEQLDGQSVALSEVLTNAFIQDNSSFDSFEDLIKASGFTVESRTDFEAIPDEEWDDFISKNTNFNSWQEMINSAGAIYARSKLGL